MLSQDLKPPANLPETFKMSAPSQNDNVTRQELASKRKGARKALRGVTHAIAGRIQICCLRLNPSVTSALPLAENHKKLVDPRNRALADTVKKANEVFEGYRDGGFFM